MRYLKAGFGPALILLHTVRTQLDHFQLVIPKPVHAFTVFAIDFPRMRWPDITPGASYDEPALRRAIVEFVKTLDLDDVTLAGESMGATVSLTASTELEDRVRRIVAFNTYNYPEGVGRANLPASIYVGGAPLPAIGPVVAKMALRVDRTQRPPAIRRGRPPGAPPLQPRLNNRSALVDSTRLITRGRSQPRHPSSSDDAGRCQQRLQLRRAVAPMRKPVVGPGRPRTVRSAPCPGTALHPREQEDVSD